MEVAIREKSGIGMEMEVGRKVAGTTLSLSPRLLPQPQHYLRSHPSFNSDLSLRSKSKSIAESRTKYQLNTHIQTTCIAIQAGSKTSSLALDYQDSTMDPRHPTRYDHTMQFWKFEKPAPPYQQSKAVPRPQKLPYTSLNSSPPIQLTPGEGFKKLPQSILLQILAQLKSTHTECRSLSCFTCYTRNLGAVALANKKWWGAVQIALYEEIQLNGADNRVHVKMFKRDYGSRLILLRRTLRDRPDIAGNVKSFKPPAIPDTMKPNEQEQYLDLIASVIQTCLNLEKLVGVYPSYKHEFTRIHHVLSLKRTLTEKVWIMDPSAFKRQTRYKLSEDKTAVLPSTSPAQLLPEECSTFRSLHSNWPNLKTLVLHCNSGGTIESSLFGEVFSQLSSLQNLHISDFSLESFNDETLLLLPALKALRLENLSGITAAGLSNYATRGQNACLTTLSLVSLPVLSLPVLPRLFSSLKALTCFTISQEPSPTLPIGTSIYLQPYFSSQTLEYIHWEFTDADDNIANMYLAESILSKGFPALKTLRAPTDHDGLLQKLCKPQETIKLPSDTFRNVDVNYRIAGQPRHCPSPSITSSIAKSPTWSVFSNPFSRRTSSSNGSASGSGSAPPEREMHLVTARRRAQDRIDDAQCTMTINVWNEKGQLVKNVAGGKFLGKLDSKIMYSLLPDVDGMDQALVGIEDLLDNSKEVNVRDGCTGSWNVGAEDGVKGRDGKKGSAKGKDRWSHTERCRWTEIPLEKLFQRVT
jgi:hypothetical protein